VPERLDINLDRGYGSRRVVRCHLQPVRRHCRVSSRRGRVNGDLTLRGASCFRLPRWRLRHLQDASDLGPGGTRPLLRRRSFAPGEAGGLLSIVSGTTAQPPYGGADRGEQVSPALCSVLAFLTSSVSVRLRARVPRRPTGRWIRGAPSRPTSACGPPCSPSPGGSADRRRSTDREPRAARTCAARRGRSTSDTRSRRTPSRCPGGDAVDRHAPWWRP